MLDKNYSLSTDEINALDNLLYDNQNKVKRNSIIFTLIAFVVSIIPMGFWPRSKRLSDEDKSINLIQAMGFGWWILLITLVTIGVIFLLRLDKKISALKKDSEEKQGLVLNVKVTKKIFRIYA